MNAHAPAPPPPGKLQRVWNHIDRLPRKVVIPGLAAGMVGLLAIGGIAGANDRPSAMAAAATTKAPTKQSPTTQSPTTVAATTVPATVATRATTVAPPPAPTPAPTTVTPRLTVSAVVDGDTVDLSSGEQVRIIGIDTPEQGQPGYAEAAAAMSAMVLGHDVILTPGARDDRDIYGRLLRYVDVDGQDAGLAMVNQGWAIARYDSRDGYGHHTREESYVAADSASLPAYTVAPPPPPPAPLAAVPPAATDPNMGTCKAAKAAGYGPYDSGQDPEYDWYRDADSDGIVCE